MRIIIVLSFLLMSLQIRAQIKYSFNVQYEGKKYKVGETAIVRDSVNNILSYPVWSAKMNTGEFILKPFTIIMGEPTEFLIRRLTENESSEIRRKVQQKTTRASNYSNLSLTDIDGKKYAYPDLAGKVVVLNFWFTGCAPCIKEIPELNNLVKDFSGKQVVFLALSSTDSPELIRKFVQRKSFNYKLIAESESRPFIQQRGIMYFPTHVVLDKVGNFAFGSSGYSKETVEILRSEITKLIK